MIRRTLSRYSLPVATVVAGILSAPLADAAPPVQVRVTIENLSQAGGVALSPFFLAAHDGTFDAFDVGAAASPGIQNIAELGDGSALVAAFAAANPAGVSGTAVATVNAFGPGIYLPGGSGSLVLTLDPAIHRYLSFGAMVVPSNDFFLGNGSPTAVELFDAGGAFTASSLTLMGANIWDAGTEVNGPSGAAFLAGQDATAHIAEGGVIATGGNFAPYAGAATAAGYAFTAAPQAGDPVARISFAVVPEPATLSAAGAGALIALVAGRRRRNRR